jgi:Chaperone of endosialidase
MSKRSLWGILTAGCLALATVAPAPAAPSQACGPDPNGRVADVSYHDTTIYWDPVVEYKALVLTIGGPCEDIVRIFGSGEPVSFDIRDIQRVTDGKYTWELRRIATIDPVTQAALAEARQSGNEGIWWALWQAGRIPEGPYVDSASFTVDRGVIVQPDLEERRTPLAASGLDGAAPELAPAATAGADAPALAATGAEGPSLATRGTVLTNADGIIRNSLCVGFDCPTSPTFSDSTILLMENNTRIKFDDTSTLSGFPNNDWELQANSSNSGGGNFFAVNDCANSSQGGCADDPVFKIEAGVRANALYVESDGDVGVGTANPVTRMHLVDSDTPAVRLEQDGSGGFAPQTWDVAGNETTFFIRDVTNGSSLPFRIEPGTGSNTLYLDSDERVGVGTSSPSANLHVLETANAATGDVHLLVENSNATTLARTMMKLSNNGNTFFDMENRNAHTWRINSNNSQFLVLDDQNDAGTEFELRPNGELRLEGALVTTSTRDAKQDIAPADSQAILARLTALPIATWSYKQDPGSKHLGPMAEDFYDAFGLGSTNKGISVLDASTVALAAIQALSHQLDLKQQQVDTLEARLKAVEKLLAQTP